MATHTGVMIEAAEAAGQVLVRYFKEGVERERKPDASLVSVADREAEQIILDVLTNHFPYGVVAEESGSSGDHEFTWLIDPIDGTGNFLMGIPFWCTTIALLHGDEIEAGVVYVPLTETVYSVERGKGFRRAQEDTRYVYLDPAHGRGFSSFMSRVGSIVDVSGKSARYMGAAALTLALVSSGSALAFIGEGQEIWDVAAGVLMAREAGLRTTDMEGNQWSTDSPSLLVAPPEAHTSMLSVLSKGSDERQEQHL